MGPRVKTIGISVKMKKQMFSKQLGTYVINDNL